MAAVGSTSPFDNLPREIRDKIWEYVVVNFK